MGDTKVQPGFFTLPLVINRGTFESAAVNYKFEILEKFLDCKRDREEKYAIKNLLGLLSARLKRYEEAMKYFKEVLSEDPTNLNALANRKSLCDILYKFNEAKECGNALQRLCQESSTINEFNCRNARCLAEQAYAFVFDMFDDAIGYERYLSAHELYKRAFALAGNNLDEREKQDWELSNAIACKKISRAMRKNGEPVDNYLKYVESSLTNFYGIVQNGDKHMKTDSWGHIGEIFDTWPYDYKRLSVISDYPDLEQYYRDPKKCLEEALKITPDEPRSLTRLAKMINKQNSKEALSLYKESIRRDSSSANRWAFVSQGMTLLHLYRDQQNAYLEDEGPSPTPPDRQLLLDAKEMLEQALSFNVSPREYSSLAYTWQLLATDEREQIQDCLNKALIYHAKAINCENGAMREDINRFRGISLSEAKEYDAAIESFKRAMECQPKTNKSPRNFFYLMRVYLKMISETGPSKIKRHCLLELEYWADMAIRKCSVRKLKDNTVPSLWQHYPNEMNRFVTFCHDWDRRLISRIFAKPKPDPHGQPASHASRSKQHVLSIPCTFNIFEVLEDELDDMTMPAEEDEESYKEVESEVPKTTDHSNNRPREEEKTSENASAPLTQSDDEEQPTASDHHETSTEEGVSKEDKVENHERRVEEEDLRSDEMVDPPEKARFPGRDYDFFAIYPESVCKWVYYQLLPMLERTHHLKGCIKDRDFVPGRFVLDNYNKCIESSSSYLMIITKEFIQDCECYLAMKQCMCPSKTDPVQPRRLIPILVEKCEIPKDISPKTPFDATGVPNWELLLQAIQECADAKVLE